MRAILVLLAFTSLTFGQDRDRVFYLTHTETTQQFLEVATVIRTIANIRSLPITIKEREGSTSDGPDRHGGVAVQ
jgi:hypothetical protein